MWKEYKEANIQKFILALFKQKKTQSVQEKIDILLVIKHIKIEILQHYMIAAQNIHLLYI